MGAFLLRRLLLGAVVLVAVSFGSFWFFARNFYIAPETLLPVPPAAAWWTWFKGIPGGSIGRGVQGQDLWGQTVPALWHTAILLAAALILVVVFSLLIGVVSATRAGGWTDGSLRLLTYLSWGVPASDSTPPPITPSPCSDSSECPCPRSSSRSSCRSSC